MQQATPSSRHLLFEYIHPSYLSDSCVVFQGKSTCLKQGSLVLPLVDVEVLPHHNRGNTQDQDRGRADAVLALDPAVGVVDGLAGLGARRVAELGVDSADEDGGSLRLHVGRQAVGQGGQEQVVVDTGAGGLADGAADGVEQVDQRKGQGNTLAVTAGHHGHVLTDDQRTAGEGDEDLAHDQVADAVVGAAEVDHQTGAEDHQRKTEAQAQVLEVLGLVDVDSDHDGEESGADTVGLHGVAGVDLADVVDGEQEVLEPDIPHREVEVENGGQQTGTGHGAVLEDFIANEVSAGEPLLPNEEGRE